jgi:hypothetical protein
MQFSTLAATLLAAAPLALAQSSVTKAPSATSSASGMVVTMMWDNSPTAGAVATSGASKEAGKAAASMTMSDGKVMSAMSQMSGMSGMSMTTATGTAMAGMNMTGAAGRTELAPGAMGVGWIVISLGAGVGFLAGAL